MLFSYWSETIISCSIYGEWPSISIFKTINTLNKCFESKLNVFSSGCRSWQIHEFLLCCIVLYILLPYVMLWEVTLVSNQQNADLRLAVLSHFPQPSLDMLKSWEFTQVEHYYSPDCPSVVRTGQSSELFLSCCVPDLIFNCHIPDFYSFSAKLNSNCGFRIDDKLIINETRQNLSFPHIRITDNHEFK